MSLVSSWKPPDGAFLFLLSPQSPGEMEEVEGPGGERREEAPEEDEEEAAPPAVEVATCRARVGGVSAALDDPEVDECEPTLLGEQALLSDGEGVLLMPDRIPACTADAREDDPVEPLVAVVVAAAAVDAAALP